LKPPTTLTDGTITTRDGRALAYAEYGDRSGRPVFYFHGFPGSRLEISLASAAASDSRVRLIAVDRPGYGRSDFKSGRRILDWPDDVTDLADGLRIDRFAALGASGGGPYLCACALKLSRRITRAGIFCGLGPLDRHGATGDMLPEHRTILGLVGRFPSTAPLMARLVTAMMLWSPEMAMTQFARRLPEVDREILSDPVSRRVFIESYQEALRGGPRGAARDLRLYTRPWGFGQDEIEMPVHFWHGEQDTIVPPSLARAQLGALRDGRARFFPGDAHFSVVFNYTREMLRLLTSEPDLDRAGA
jgi:pimeloyl-ACP methyl ester carboxylesterase